MSLTIALSGGEKNNGSRVVLGISFSVLRAAALGVLPECYTSLGPYAQGQLTVPSSSLRQAEQCPVRMRRMLAVYPVSQHRAERFTPVLFQSPCHP